MKAVNLLIKPASSLCNMRCSYCFYHDVAQTRQTPSFGMMSKQTAGQVIARAFQAVQPGGRVGFAFQGGEPTLAGLDFFEHFVKTAKRLNTNNLQMNFSLQTNGLLIDDSWCGFLKEHNFLVGLSLDGYDQIHDLNRRDNAQNPTYKRVFAAAKLMERHGVEFNLLCVITKRFAAHARGVFKFLRQNGFDYVQTIPCLAPLEGEKNGRELTARDYARFLKEFFALYYQAAVDNRYISVGSFDNYVRMLKGLPPGACGFLGFCAIQFVVEADGGVYPCDFYVLEEHLLGNVGENSLDELAWSAAAQDFLKDNYTKPDICTSCRFFKLCGGGCKRHRGLYFGENGYCPVQDFLQECYPKMLELARRL